MNKKLASSLLASVMALSTLSMTAFADAGKTGENTIKVDTSFQAPTLSVTIPTAIGVAINPYHLELTVDKNDNTLKTGTDGLASGEYEIENTDTTMGVVVKAYAWGKGTGVELVAPNAKTGAQPTLSTTDKQAFAFLNTSKTQGTYDDDTFNPDSDVQLAFSDSKQDAAKELQKLDVSEKCFFKVQGDVTEEPEKDWATTDALTLNLIFDLKPYNPAYGSGEDGPVVAAPKVKVSTDDSTFNGITLTGTTFKVTSDLSDGSSDTADMTLCDEAGATIKKTGTDVTVAVKTDADSILNINNAGKITVATTGTPGTYTATITLTDTASGDTQDYTITMKEIA